MNWSHKDEWQHKTQGFSVIICRWSHKTLNDIPGFSDEFDGGNHWNIYAYIYPSHKLFNEFKVDGGIFDQPDLNFHGGTTYFKSHYDTKGSITCYQIGCDYNHYGDSNYTFMKTKEDAYKIFNDAEIIIDLLSK